MANKNLLIDDKIGQRFIFGINSSDIECILKLIKNYKIGGVILYKKNYNSYDEMLDVIKKIKLANKKNNIPLFIAIDQEGGRVNRLPDCFHNLKSIYDVSSKGESFVCNYANIISDILYKSGINMNFAPVLDLYDDYKSKLLYKRCFYGDISNITNLAKSYIRTSKKNNVLSVVKHYPGHGASSFDSHLIIPYVFNYSSVLNRHMAVFNNVIDDTDALMAGHIIIRKLTKLLPCTISDGFLNKKLRIEQGYDGLLITDELNMLKRNFIYRFIYLNKALKSCNDMLLVKIKNYNEGEKIINKYKRILKKRQLYVNRLSDNVNRILCVKKKYNINDNVLYDGVSISSVNDRIDSINGRV